MQVVRRLSDNEHSSPHPANLASIELYIPAMYRLAGKTLTKSKDRPINTFQIDWLTALIRDHNNLALQTKPTSFNHITYSPFQYGCTGVNPEETPDTHR